MATGRNFIAAAPLAAAAVQGRAAFAQDKSANFLFVQNAQSMAYASGKLTLKGVSPVTVFFANRPDGSPAIWRPAVLPP
jgi:hypothetical protein